MLSFVATILVLALLVYKAWPWFWHIVTSLFLALLLYIAWPWFLQKPWEDLMSRLQQIHLPQQIASASDTPSGRLYVSPERTDETRIHFEELGQAVYPRPYPRPFPCAQDWAGKDVFLWEGRRWYLPHNAQPYRYLCVPERKLEWCWPIPPNASAVPCKSPDTGEDGWCWRNQVSYRNDS